MFPELDRYVNIHAHRLSSGLDEWVLTNLLIQDYPPDSYEEAQYSVGLHPWHIDELDFEQMLKKVQVSTENMKVVAIGETGLDKAIKTPMDLQRRIFEIQVEIAEQNDLAVIVHVVKAYNELKEFVSVHKPVVPMIIHGFRGGRQLAEEMLKAGFYLSLGSHLMESEELQEVLEIIPLNRLFLESDDSKVDIRTLYKKVAEIREAPLDSLKMRLGTNTSRVFQRRTEF